MSGSRGFFYDDCRSGDRLAREYTVIAGTWSSQYASPYFVYQCEDSAGVNDIMYLASFQHPRMFDIRALVNIVSSTHANKQIGLIASYALLAGAADVSNSIQLILRQNIPDLYLFGPTFAISTPMTINLNTWYYLRLMYNGTNVKGKAWQRGTQEPDWQAAAKVSSKSGSGGWLSRQGQVFGLRSISSLNRVADIRITPIPRTGGVP